MKSPPDQCTDEEAPRRVGNPVTGRSGAFGPATAGSHIKRLSGACGKKAISLIAKSGITSNEITVIGLILVVANCAVYLRYRNAFWLGTGLAASFAFDSLDGAVARY